MLSTLVKITLPSSGAKAERNRERARRRGRNWQGYFYQLPNRDNSPLSGWIATGFVITAVSVTERILVVFVREAKAL